MTITELKNKRALVTGASRGIGFAIARALAAQGLNLFLTARDERALAKAKAELSGMGGNIGYATADLADVTQLGSMSDAAMEFLGGIDVLVNNAGVGFKKPVALMDMTEWEQMFAVNLRAAFILSKLALGKMIPQKSGYIINIGSGASQTPIAEFAGYCSTKYGLLGFSESLALEVRDYGIKVSIIMPGSTATHFGGSSPQSKLDSKPGMLRPKDIADALLFLLKQSPNAWTSVMNVRPLSLHGG
jgi:3-oxoacyl-[acyl-carrier protein] reductase